MSHPFTRLIETALKKSTLQNNLVLKKVHELIGKGYRTQEVTDVLKSLVDGRIDSTEEAILRDALDEIRGEDNDSENDTDD